MYHEFYDLPQNPFSNTPDPAFLFLSPGHKAVLQALLDSITAAQGCVALVGEAGLGKTLLLRALLEHIDHQYYKAIWVWYPALSLQEMLKSICQESGRDCPIDDPVATTRYLQQIWLEEHTQGRKVILIIDEAHNIPGETLEGLLRLASLDVAPGKPLIHLVFAGLPEFWQRVHARSLRSGKKPCLRRVRLSPLTRKESMEYIRHRLLKVVASADAPFTNKALQQVVHYARGNPGMLNTLCTNMLIMSRLSHEKLVSAEIAQEVLAAYRKRRSRPGLWRGIAYAASVLLVASLVGGVQYGYLAVSPRGSLELSHLMQRFLRPWSAHGAPQPVDVAVPILQREPTVPFVHPEPAVSPVHVAAVPELQMLSVPLVSGPFEPQLPEPVSPQSAEVVATQLAPASFEPQSPAQGALHTAETASQEEHPPASPSELPVAGPVAQAPVAPRETLQATKSPGTGKTRHSVPSGAAQPPRKRPAAVPPDHVAALQAPHTPQPAPKTMTPRAPGQVLPRTPERAVSKRGTPTVVPEPSGVLPATAAPVVPLETGPAAESPGAGDARSGTLVSKSPGAREEAPARDRETLQARPDSAVLSPPLLPPGAPSFAGSSQFVVEAGGHAAMIRQLLFTADGRELISVSDDKTVRVWSVTPDGRQASLARTIRGQTGDGPEGMLAAATLSPPNAAGRQQWLAVGGVLAGSPRDRYAVRLHDYASGEVVGLLHGHEETVLALAFSPTGRWLASAGKDCTVRLWDLASFQGSHFAKAPLVLAAHTDHIYDLAWSATGDRLASASYDHSVGLWNTEQLAQGQMIPVARLRGHDQQVQTVAFHPEGSVLVSGGKDQTIRLWRAQDGEALGVFARPKHKVSALSFAPDGRSLLAGNFSPPRPDRLTLLAYPSGKTQQVFTGHQNVVVATAFHPGGQWVASGGGEQKEILLWQVHTGEVLSRLAGTGRTIYAVGFSRDGRYLSWGQTPHDTFPNTRGVLEHRFDLTQLVRRPGVSSDTAVVRAQESVGDVSLSAERGGPYDHHYRLHVRKGPRRLSTLERGDTDGYRHSAYTLTPDGQGVLSGGMNGVLRLYALDGTLRARFLGHTGEIRAVAVSADGQWALSGSNDQTLRLWSLAALPASGSMDIVPTLTLFPAADGEWVAWTPEGARVASPHGARLLGHSINQGPDKVARYVPVEQWPTRLLQPEMILPKLQSRLQ